MITAAIQKKNGEKITKCVSIVNGIITVDGRRPLFCGDLLKKYGLSLDRAKNMTVTALTAEYKKCVYSEGTMEDGTIVTLRDPDVERKTEKVKQNTFLKNHGYVWKKESHYISGGEDPTGKYDGDFREEWVLRGHGGKEVENANDFLIDLGYFGDKGKADREEKRAALAVENQKREEAKQAKVEVNAYFESEPFEKPAVVEKFTVGTFHFPREGFSIGGSGQGFSIQENALWQIVNNGMDGDDWSLNNYKTGGAGAIAKRYQYNERIVGLIRKFCDLGLIG